MTIETNPNQMSSGRIDSHEKRSRTGELLASLIVNHMLPFFILSRKGGKKKLYPLLNILNPSYAEHITRSTRMASKNFDAYYDEFVTRVKTSVIAGLNHSLGTFFFDGWKDESHSNVVNIPLAITGINRVRKTFFQRSIYTG